MASFNKVLLMGNLTRDPELRFTGITHIAIDEDNGRARANLIKVYPPG